MKRFAACNLAVSFCAALLAFAPSALAADGNVLINQDTSTSAFGLGCRTNGFPIVICQPGSYRLSGNLIVPNANTSAISIRADNVTLDLNGFSILGPTICKGSQGFSVTCSPTGGGFGVDAVASQGVTIMNGNVSGMGSDGINSLAGDVYVAKVHAQSNGRAGISIGGGTVIGNTVSLNGGDGIDTGLGTVSGNNVFLNRRTGIFALSSTVSGNSVFGNGGNGVSGDALMVSGNTVTGNRDFAVTLTCPSLLIGNTVVGGGFGTGNGCVFVNNAGQ